MEYISHLWLLGNITHIMNNTAIIADWILVITAMLFMFVLVAPTAKITTNDEVAAIMLCITMSLFPMGLFSKHIHYKHKFSDNMTYLIKVFKSVLLAICVLSIVLLY